MIKLNRIGNKLGLAGAVGILPSIGMVANQMLSEAEVEAANQRTARAQRVIDGVMAASSTCARSNLPQAMSGCADDG